MHPSLEIASMVIATAVIAGEHLLTMRTDTPLYYSRVEPRILKVKAMKAGRKLAAL